MASFQFEISIVNYKSEISKKKIPNCQNRIIFSKSEITIIQPEITKHCTIDTLLLRLPGQ